MSTTSQGQLKQGTELYSVFAKAQNQASILNSRSRADLYLRRTKYNITIKSQGKRGQTNPIHNAANKAMPLKARGNYTYKDSWYYCPEVRVLKTRLNRVRKLYRRRPNTENRELLQTVNTDVQQQLETIRNEKWIEWCSHISNHSTLSDIWKWLKIVSNKQKQRQSRHPQPLQEAERLADNFSDRTKSENLPPETRTT